MKSMIVLFLIFTSFSLNEPFVYSQADSEKQEPAVKAYFVGYDEDDLIFHIVNQTQETLTIRGLSYQRQILYRPIEKDVAIAPMSDGYTFGEVKLRTTGDFVWSQNHMHMFQLTYTILNQKEKKYASLLLKEALSQE